MVLQDVKSSRNAAIEIRSHTYCNYLLINKYDYVTSGICHVCDDVSRCFGLGDILTTTVTAPGLTLILMNHDYVHDDDERQTGADNCQHLGY